MWPFLSRSNKNGGYIGILKSKPKQKDSSSKIIISRYSKPQHQYIPCVLRLTSTEMHLKLIIY